MNSISSKGVRDAIPVRELEDMATGARLLQSCVSAYSLVSQMTRAANSASLNIAEGAGRDTNIDFSRFLGIAMGSTFEVASALFLALDRGYIDGRTHSTIYSEAEQLAKSINSFRKTLEHGK